MGTNVKGSKHIQVNFDHPALSCHVVQNTGFKTDPTSTIETRHKGVLPRKKTQIYHLIVRPSANKAQPQTQNERKLRITKEFQKDLNIEHI